MTDQERKAMEMALEALDSCEFDYDNEEKQVRTFDALLVNAAHRALHEALAQPEQERNFCQRCGKRLFAGHIHTCTPPVEQPEQEPVLQVYRGEICYKSQDDDQSFGMWCSVNYNTEHGYPNGTKFYTAPPKREWVGLKDIEIVNIMDEELTTQSTEHFALCQAIEAALKEKNT